MPPPRSTTATSARPGRRGARSVRPALLPRAGRLGILPSLLLAAVAALIGIHLTAGPPPPATLVTAPPAGSTAPQAGPTGPQAGASGADLRNRSTVAGAPQVGQFDVVDVPALAGPLTAPGDPVPEPAPTTAPPGAGSAAGTGAGDTAGQGAGQGAGSGQLTLDLSGKGLDNPLSIVVLLGVASLVPALLLAITAFTRIIIVLGFTRTALGANSVPPNQVLIGLGIFLTFFVMGPTLAQANTDGLQPMLKGEVSSSVAFDNGIKPFKEFMCAQLKESDLGPMVKLSGKPPAQSCQTTALPTLVPAFTVHELKSGFLIGFVIFIPFLVIDLVVSAALSSLGMVMLPPVLISLPFKLLLFVAADGWTLVVESLVRSFQPVG